MRYDVAPPTPPSPIVEGDRRFVGLRMNAPRQYLAEGYYARGENVRIDKGMETRPGTRTPLFANLFPTSIFRGSGTYSNPNGYELGLLAGTTLGISRVYGIRNGTVPLTISVQTPFTGTQVEFSQHFDKIFLHQNDASAVTMVWDGVSAEDGFIAIEAATDIPGYAALPNPPWSIHFDGRAVFPIPGEPDQLGFSDRNNPTTYDTLRHKFRVNTGTSDSIVGVYQYLSNNLIVGKERSLDLIPNIPQDLGDSFLNAIFAGLAPASPAPPSTVSISNDVGLIARKAAIVVGGRFMFLSNAGDGGIYQVTTDQHSNYVVDTTPVSLPIDALIRRINWPFAGGALASSDGRRVYWSVPLDSSITNNANLVYNLATGEWESLDLWNALPRNFVGGDVESTDSPMRMDNIFRLNFYGASSLFAVNNAKGKVHLLHRGSDDQLALAPDNTAVEPATWPIQLVMETRGYSQVANDGRTERQSSDVNIQTETLEPTLTFYQLIDGSNGDETPLWQFPFAPDRSEYSQLRKGGFDLSNENRDAEDPKRDDYAVHVGDGVLLQDTGVRLMRMAPWTHNFSLSDVGRTVSFRVVNNTGLCRVISVIFESASTESARGAV